MASTVEEIEAAIQEAVETGFRGRLLERGLARSMIWVDGILPNGSPNFADNLSYDLLSYGYSLLSLAIRLKEMNGNLELRQIAFESSASAISDVIHNGNPDDRENGFHKVVAASAFHLGHFSAKAYSLIHDNIENENLSRIEIGLSRLILRQFDALEELILGWRSSGTGSDAALANFIESEINRVAEAIETETPLQEVGISSIELPVVDLAITDNYYSALLSFLWALETGNRDLVEAATLQIDTSLEACAELNMVPQWWVLRLTKHLLDDLWDSSFHEILPFDPAPENGEWLRLRRLYITSLFKRSKAEIELWPSQIEGAKRSVNDFDDLVISLPTSAGKTRIAELCILRCLAIGKRVVFITPLRALSAQTESSLRKTFLPLGKTVSTLYGKIGASAHEQDALRTNDIVVGTPEKLDFALRNDPSLLDDVGLIVLDEGHMIGLSEREINYEIQIQRLLSRSDADQRRIVCLSAILPEGEQLEDFVGWLRRDKEGNPIKSSWRPTNLRFGEIVWKSNAGQINFTIGEVSPFIPRYIMPTVPPVGRRTTPFPRDAQELTLATSWKLVEDKHTVLIYCPTKRSVNAFAGTIVDLYQKGALQSVLEAPIQDIEAAKTLGREWLGVEHPIVQCLDIGVAIHHGTLPRSFRKEIERLLREGVLKVTVSSPTLAQGLNLGATTVIVYSLHRNGNLIDASEFRNVVGRAGRAFVDIHGLVLHPVFDKHAHRISQWRGLVADASARDLVSGLVKLVNSLLSRMAEGLRTQEIKEISEYVLNNSAVWNCPTVPSENTEESERAQNTWSENIQLLDTALLSMLGSDDISKDNIPEALDAILQSSLWQRFLSRQEDSRQVLCLSVLRHRANFIWEATTPLQRRGYYLAGVGLETGLRLDEIAETVNNLLESANGYIANMEDELAIQTIIQLAEIVFTIPTFAPNKLPDNWKNITTTWLSGEAFSEANLDDVDEALEFVEDGLAYRLIWGLEAVRVRVKANEEVELAELSDISDIFEHPMRIDDRESGQVIPALEFGTLSRSGLLLMQYGFSSREAALIAVKATNASFLNKTQCREWLNSENMSIFATQMDWPTAGTASMWKDFAREFQIGENTAWGVSAARFLVVWAEGYVPVTGSQVKIINLEDKTVEVIGGSRDSVGTLSARYNLLDTGVYSAVIAGDTNFIDVEFCGSGDNPFERIDI